MLDSNVASDYKAIMKLFNIGDSEQNYKILQKLIEDNSIIGTIKDRYDLNREFTSTQPQSHPPQYSDFLNSYPISFFIFYPFLFFDNILE